MEKNQTALVSCFARAYHFRNSREWVFKDDGAEKLLREEEYRSIASNMSAGISFFDPGFKGSPEAALRHIVNRHLAPPVLARSAFCEQALKNAVRLGCSQYVLFGSGYDSFSLRCGTEGLTLYELDRPEMIEDKQARLSAGQTECRCPTVYLPCDLAGDAWTEELKKTGFSTDRRSFGGLLGLSYYLTGAEFEGLLEKISRLFPEGSSIVFDYPAPGGGAESGKTEELARGAGEEMKSKYSYSEMERLLEAHGFLIYEHLDDKEMTETFFAGYNRSDPEEPMQAPAGVNYCLAVRRGGR